MAICKTCRGTGEHFHEIDGSSYLCCENCDGTGIDGEIERDNRCKNCILEPLNSGCTTGYNSVVCKLNRKDKKEDARTEEKKKIESLLLDVSKIKEGATSDMSYADKIKELMKARRRLIKLGRKKV